MGEPNKARDATYDTIGTADRTAMASISPNRNARERAQGDIHTFQKASEFPGETGAKARRVLSRIAKTTAKLREILPASWFEEK